MNSRDTAAAAAPTAVIAEDEALLAEELEDLLRTLWPALPVWKRSMRSKSTRRTWRSWTSTCRC